jgi:hypothetical protein
MLTVAELIEKLRAFPPDWQVVATRAGGSLEVSEPEKGIEYAYVFTDDRPTRKLTDRRKQRQDETKGAG